MKGKLFIISAPSGAGKTTLVHRVLADLENEVTLQRVITYTTKAPRAGEKEGRDYHFVSKEQFDQFLAQGFFMEYSKAYTDYYGSPVSVIEGLSQGISFILIVDRVGAQEIIKKVPDAILIWIETPSLEILRRRLTSRGTDSPERIERRLFRAQQEIVLERTTPLYTYHMVNDTLNEAVFEFKAILCQEIGAKSLLFSPKNRVEVSASDSLF